MIRQLFCCTLLQTPEEPVFRFLLCYNVTIMTLYDFESAHESFLAWLLLERG